MRADFRRNANISSLAGSNDFSSESKHAGFFFFFFFFFLYKRPVATKAEGGGGVWPLFAAA